RIVNAQRIAGVEQTSGHRFAHAARADKADCFYCHGSLPVAPANMGAFLVFTRSWVPGRVSSNFKIVSQSVKHKILIDRARCAGIGSKKRSPRNSPSAAR